jgi:cell wall-associated NlpC family hydrolase
MVDGITNVVRVPTAVPFGARQMHHRDSRECPGPNSEAELSRPSTRRALTAGAIVLAVIAPTVEIAERPAEAGPPPPAGPVVAATSGFNPIVTLAKRSPRASRLAARGPAAAHRAGVRPAAAHRAAAHRPAAHRPAAHRPVTDRIVADRTVADRAGVRPVAVAAQRMVRAAAQRERARIATVRRARVKAQARIRAIEVRQAEQRTAERRRGSEPRRATTPRKARTTVRVKGVSARMAAVVAYARAQVGKRYRSGGEGPNSFDCSGFTKRAYAQAGIRLPHSSGAQAARARKISRIQGRPGDLVYGPGHVGVYMGGGMMIDAGNRRTGVVFRRLYAGLRIARF